MTSGADGEWVRQGTPHDDSANWNEEQSEYGTAISPTEWDDYSSEQSVPVSPPRAQDASGIATARTPDSPTGEDPQPVPGQEPGAGEEYRSEEVDTEVGGEPVGDADDSGLDPAPIEEPDLSGDTATTAGIATDNDRGSATGHDVDERVETSEPETAHHAAVVPPIEEPQSRDVAAEPVFEEEETRPVVEDTVEEAPRDPVDEAPQDVVHEGGAGGVETGAHDPDDELTRRVHHDDLEATQAVPVTAVEAPEAPTPAAIPPGLYRADGSEETAVIAEDAYPNQDVDVEEERLQAQLAAERQAREQRLGTVPTSSDNAIREDAGPPRVTTDRFFPSFGLFVLRIVTAGILGVISWQILGSGVDETANFLAGYPLIPEPRLVAWILGFTLGALALLLVIGLLQRVVGFVLLVVSVASLVFIRWGTTFSIFSEGSEGFIGDRDLLLAVVGLLLLSMGGGRWGIDGAFRSARAASKAEREG